LLESQLEKKLNVEVGRLGGKSMKWVSPGLRGVPDRIILFPGGRIFFVEMKAPGKSLRPLQEKRKREIETLGFRIYKIDSVEDINTLLEMVTNGI